MANRYCGKPTFLRISFSRPSPRSKANSGYVRARLAQGRTSEAIQILATADQPLQRAYLGNAYARAGRRDEAEKLAASLAPNPFQEALIYAGLGDKDRTLEALQRMTALGPARVGRALTYPEFALLRGDGRLKGIRKKAGLPE